MLTPPDDLSTDATQAALTERFLLPALAEIEAALLELRVDTDQALAGKVPTYKGKPYPYGCCHEITLDVMGRVAAFAAQRRSPGQLALNDFFRRGGRGKLIWGVLRDSYFQNAMHLGGLYVDVSNDTVDVTKPKVEILPMDRSGLVLIQDAVHFARVAERYWDARAYANTLLPSLAPLFPVVLVDSRGQITIQSNAGYMKRLLGTDSFVRSQQWLRTAPRLPDTLAAAFRSACPPDLQAANPEVGLAAAVTACEALRSTVIDAAWVQRMSEAFVRVPAMTVSRTPAA
ncbi:hypothetical protein [Caulobacter sp. RHG1]|uniref:hypothetical protein n=1 Tax=Caulobacter sp. (strain RHG1) TaxID=2545762 RepID=UPI001556BA5F|nr:hypothetical protein [Caulobacter sp. RHG1]NQE60829.1 hypothetical protein [Caulobacter sp. RHG1]